MNASARRRYVGFAIVLVLSFFTLAFAKDARAYWDFQGFLYNPGTPNEYAEGHYNVGRYWTRVSRNNCAAKIQLWNLNTGWENVVFGCQYLDIRVDYDTSYYQASRAINGTAGTTVYVNVRIAATL
jgi:hypothetical protein